MCQSVGTTRQPHCPKLLLICSAAVALLSACTWETYENQSGQTRLRPKYPAGSGVYYTEGAASPNPHYHSHRPMPHIVPPASRTQP